MMIFVFVIIIKDQSKGQGDVQSMTEEDEMLFLIVSSV